MNTENDAMSTIAIKDTDIISLLTAKWKVYIINMYLNTYSDIAFTYFDSLSFCALNDIPIIDSVNKIY